MSTTEAYWECEYGPHPDHTGDCPGEPTVCPYCGVWDGRAPWSYQELVGVIGLEAMYQVQLQQSLRAGVKIPLREMWAATPAPCWLSPAMAILALQAGVQFSAPALAPVGKVLPNGPK